MANSIVAPQWSDIDDDALTPSELKPVFVSPSPRNLLTARPPGGLDRDIRPPGGIRKCTANQLRKVAQ
jgi:hypothetical protein